jgi:hypothetical protein
MVMKTKYIRKARSASRWYGTRVFHLIQPDGKVSQCGAIRFNEVGYEVVERSTKPLPSLTCANCLNAKTRK